MALSIFLAVRNFLGAFIWLVIIFLAASSSMGVLDSLAAITTRFKAPSSSRMLVFTLSAIYMSTFSGIVIFFVSVLVRKIKRRVSKSGRPMSAIIPPSKRERNRSSSVAMACGGRSDDMMIWLFFWYNVLNMWKNSSCIFSVRAINCISSIIKQSTVRYLSFNEFISWFLKASTTSVIYFSEGT